MQTAKRANYNSFPRQEESTDPTIQSLSTLGMRIRKAVYDGYSTPGFDNISYCTPFQSQFNRPTMPISQPPSLSMAGSTASNLSDWEEPPMTVSRPSKRKYDDVKDVELQAYESKYGALKFDEDF